MNRRRTALLILSVPIVGLLLWQWSIRPSNDRDWLTEQQVLAQATVNGDTVHIRNVHDFRYRSTEDFDVHYDDRTYDLSALTRAWFIVEPFSKWKGAAHTFVSFEFDPPRSARSAATGPQFLSISVETRKTKGADYSVFVGMLKQYELIYVIGSERDLLTLRTAYRKNAVYLYPVRATPEKVHEMFLDMIQRANQVAMHPEFYNSLWNNCTSNVIAHVGHIAPGKIPWSWQLLFPGYADRIAYDDGLIDTDLPFDQARQRYFVTDKGQRLKDDPQFSVKIREE